MAIVTEPSLVPPMRLGRLLRERRAAAGRSLEEVADAAGVSASALEDVEAGRVDLSETDLERIAPPYGIDLADVKARRMRLVIDLESGHTSVSGAERSEVVALGDQVEPVLVRYLALLYAFRGMPVGAPLPLRRVDLDVLSEALALRADDLQHRLRSLMLQPDELLERSARRFRRLRVAPTAGILVGVTAAGALLFVGEES